MFHWTSQTQYPKTPPEGNSNLDDMGQPGQTFTTTTPLWHHYHSFCRALVALSLGQVENRGEDRRGEKADLGRWKRRSRGRRTGRRRRRKESHLDLTFISGADPLSGVNSPRSWLWNREGLYACLLQCSSHKVRFHCLGGLREWLERHVLSYLQWYQ